MRRWKLADGMLKCGLLLCLVFFLVQLIQMPFRYTQMLDRAFDREAETVQTMAGAILSRHPEYEAELAQTLRMQDPALRELGAQVLARYGYTQELAVGDIPRYAILERDWQMIGILLSGTGALLLVLAAACTAVGWERRSRTVAAVISAYLQEDYSFAASLRLFGRRSRTGSYNRLGYLLQQLGYQIRLKGERLVEEKEGTKALVTDISHQLKTPIASLKTSFALSMQAETEEEREEFRRRSGTQIDKLEGLVASLVNISRLEVAMIALKPKLCGLEEILISAFETVYDKAEGKSIDIGIEVPENLVLPLDERWTTEAIVNVLDNAIKYSPSRSEISIRAQPYSSFVHIEIADEGIGVPPGERARIFQRFYRGTTPHVRACEGSGVGLYLSRSILERQGGGIAVRPRAGGGSVFVIQLRL